MGNHFVVEVRDTKNDYPRIFVIETSMYDVVKEFIFLRPSDMDSQKFYMNYNNKKCTRHVIGKNKISGIPKNVTLYSNLADPAKYAGHFWRRTLATLLSNSGVNLT